MSWEEDYLLTKVRELEARVTALEVSCPGTRSATSTEPQRTNDSSSMSSPLPPAPTTGSPSKKDPEGNSTAGSTGGPGAAESDAEPSERPEGTDYSSWSYNELLAELRRRELPRGGNTSALVTRLMNDDASRTQAH